jgi:hypothetical protein
MDFDRERPRQKNMREEKNKNKNKNKNKKKQGTPPQIQCTTQHSPASTFAHKSTGAHHYHHNQNKSKLRDGSIAEAPLPQRIEIRRLGQPISVCRVEPCREPAELDPRQRRGARAEHARIEQQ